MRRLKVAAFLLLSAGAVVDFTTGVLGVAGRGPQLVLSVVAMAVFLVCSIGGITAISMYVEMWYAYFSKGKEIHLSTTGKIIRVAIIAAIVVSVFLVFSSFGA